MEYVPSRYWFCTLPSAIMSNSSHIPNRATRFRAISVARSMSLAAPEVMVWHTTSSLDRPASSVRISARMSSRDMRNFSSSDRCRV